MEQKSGLTICFEGIDGAGKTFVLNHFKKYYESLGKDVVVVPSISLTDFKNAFDKKWYDITNKASRYVQYIAYEVNNYYKNIKPNIEAKKIVLIDRYVPSCFAYNELPGDTYDVFLINLMRITCEKFFVPDVTFVFDVPDSVLMDRFEKFRAHENKPDLVFTQKVRNGYDAFINMFGKRTYGNVSLGNWNIIKINGNQPIDKIINEMVSYIDIVKNNDKISL